MKHDVIVTDTISRKKIPLGGVMLAKATQRTKHPNRWALHPTK
ncbi:hypothetical protein CZ787_06695 [Halomonas citrativorans]|uniref:Uncharacterized protein n=1 Tax=Halomonas citrativorans TaxID=2742612 RepID=A0A1R4HW86_9GAMM|nr:hypothetical protein CZ787_06695 [Halomonas citrativorans]